LSPAPIESEPPIVANAKTAEPTKTEPASSFATGARVEGGGSEAGAGNLFDKGDAGVVAGSGTSGGGGGTAVSGLGRVQERPDYPHRPLRSRPIAKPNRFKPYALRTRPWLYGWEWKATLRSELSSTRKAK
jgi:hypothetical protein